jgi:hypothetical protein
VVLAVSAGGRAAGEWAQVALAALAEEGWASAVSGAAVAAAAPDPLKHVDSRLADLGEKLVNEACYEKRDFHV